MYTHFTAPENLPFAVALGLFVVVGLLQLVSLLTGLSLFDWLDNLMPDIDATGSVFPESVTPLDLNADGLDSLTEVSWITKVFSWMNFGRVPFIISFLLFLFLFAFIGSNGQLLLHNSGSGMLPAVVAAPLALVLSVYPLKWGNALLGGIIPRDESSAVSARSFVGRVATITIGEATHRRAAEASVKDAIGRTHYIMVRADREGVSFARGEHILVVSEQDGTYTGIAVSNPHLDT